MSGNLHAVTLTTQSTSLPDILNQRLTNWTESQNLIHSAFMDEDITE